MPLAGRTQHLLGNQLQHIQFFFRELGKILLLDFHSRDDRMMVSDLAVVDDSPDIRSSRYQAAKGENTANDTYKLFSRLSHVFRQILAIGSRICHQFLFIEALRQIQRFLCRIAIVPVAFPLKSSQIIELRWIYRFSCLLHAFHDSIRAVAGILQRPCFLL